MMFHVEHVLDKFFENKNLNEIKSQLELLKERYFKWNKVYNISSIRDEEGFWIKHVIDSLCLCKYLGTDPGAKKIIDVGSGGGFPAIILSIVLSSEITALEPIKKKTDFIDHCALRLGLKNLKTLNARFEDTKFDHDVVVSRALGMYNELCRHSFSQAKVPKVILMTTKTNLKALVYKNTIVSEQYEQVEKLTKSELRDHVLCEVYPEITNT